MGSKNKLKRFNENLTFSNVFQPTREEVVNDKVALKGKWNTDFFKNNNPIELTFISWINICVIYGIVCYGRHGSGVPKSGRHGAGDSTESTVEGANGD